MLINMKNLRNRVFWEITLFFFAFYFPGFIWGNPHKDLQDFTTYVLQFESVAIPEIFLMIYVLYIQQTFTLNRETQDIETTNISTNLESFGIVRFKVQYLLKGFISTLGIFILLFPIGFIISTILHSHNEILTEGYRWKLKNPSQLIFALVFSVTIGYREELFFRSYLLTRFKNIGVSFPIAVISSTLLFATGHIYEGYMGFVVALTIGFYLTYIFTKFNNLHINALAHGLYNFTVLFLTILIK